MSRTLATVVVACRATVPSRASSATSYSPRRRGPSSSRPRRSSPRTRSWVATASPTTSPATPAGDATASPSAPSTLTRTHEASRPRRTPSASRASTSSSSMACSRRAPSSLSSARWWSRSPSTARRTARCSHPRRGSSATAAMRREQDRAHGLQPVEEEQRRRRDRDAVQHGDEGRRRPHDESGPVGVGHVEGAVPQDAVDPGHGQGEHAQQSPPPAAITPIGVPRDAELARPLSTTTSCRRRRRPSRP